MSATYKQAVDEVLALFKAAWDTTPHAANALYDNVGGTPPGPPAVWARASVRHVASEQATLGGVGSRRFQRWGLVIVQIHVPVAGGLSEVYNLAKIVADAFEGKSTARQVWFHSVRVNELGVEGDWYQVNVLGDFTYDEVK